LRKSVELNPVDALDEEDEAEDAAPEVAEETVMARLSSSRLARRIAFEHRGGREGRSQMKRMTRRFQARIHARGIT